MGRMSDEWYRSEAELVIEQRELQHPILSSTEEDNGLVEHDGAHPDLGEGAWVQCWLWVADPPEDQCDD